MHPFSYHAPTSLGDALERLSSPGSAPLGGGTDLLVTMKEELAAPSHLVDLRRLPGSMSLSWPADGSLLIGASVRIATLAADPRVQESFPALAQSCEAVGTLALRNMGTIGGNLCQRPRCWYFRRNLPCLKNGGSTCHAVNGENQYHAIFGGGPCFIVHPSDPAVALTALDATIEIARLGETRSVPIAEFFVPPSERLDRETVLEAGEIVTGIRIPAHSSGGLQRYDKVMQRGAWDFALVSLAAVRRADGDVRLVFGGVAPTPWRVTDSIEEDIASGSLDLDDIATLAERAMYDAAPLSNNGYKVTMAATLLRRAMATLAGLQPPDDA